MNGCDLFKLRILTPARIARLLVHVFRRGVQLSNVVYMCDEKDTIALKHRGIEINYRELLKSVASVSGYLREKYKVKQGTTVLVIVDNSIPSIILLFALSALGCNIYVCPPIPDHAHFRRTVNFSKYDFIFSAIEEGYDYYNSEILHHITPAWNLAVNHDAYEPFIRHHTRISILRVAPPVSRKMHSGVIRCCNT